MAPLPPFQRFTIAALLIARILYPIPQFPSLDVLILHLLHRLLVVLFVITPHVLLYTLEHHIQCNPDDEGQPEYIHGLQTRQQPKRDVLADPALVLLGLPVEFEGADGAEGGEDGPEDDKVDVVAEVGPHEDEEGKVWDYDGGGDVVEGFGCL